MGDCKFISLIYSNELKFKIIGKERDLPITFSFSGYFQKLSVFPSKTIHLLCQAPNPETSSNMVKKPRFVTLR